MSSTEKLYYSDSHLFEFDAEVLSCEPSDNGFAVVLDRTAFFPEGGGQYSDTGFIGDAAVSDVKENTEILHYVDIPLEPGRTVHCVLDSDKRFRRMQDHSGEHIISGLVHKIHGYDNVGFHLGDGYMTIDFNGELNDEDIDRLERSANSVVYGNTPVKACFPDPDELETIEYRSKLDLKENVRLVTIEGIDCCACCAPHVAFTGEIGIIKILNCERHRGGSRLTAACGSDAFDALALMQKNASEISAMLSAKRNEIPDAVKRLLAERDALKFDMISLGNDCAAMLALNGEEKCRFFSVMPDVSARELLNTLKDSFSGVFGVFIGDDEKGYRYYIGSSSIDLKANVKRINELINGRGGGSSTMITGLASACREQIMSSFIEINA